jgi:hypothetical protein
MATKPLPGYAKPGRLARRTRRFTPYRLGLFLLIVCALIGAIAVALLVLGLLNVHAVTDHFRIY